MEHTSTIGIDLAKNSMQLHGVDKKGKVVLRKTLRRDQAAAFFANLTPCLVGMEACATSAYWTRLIERYGHDVRRIHPKFVKPYRLSGKNDANDAAAICEAVQRPHMRFVPHKSREQADIQAIHRVRRKLMHTRTAVINQARGLLGENGIVVRQGAGCLKSSLPVIMSDDENGLSGTMRSLLAALYEHILFLDARIAEQNRVLRTIARENETALRLMQIPGVGFLTATILLTVAGKPHDFKNGRAFAAYLGLVPRQYSTGGKQRLLGISRRGDTHIRTFLIHGARAVQNAIRRGGTPLGKGSGIAWITQLEDRRGHNRASVALANKMARIAWSMLAHGTTYKMAA